MNNSWVQCPKCGHKLFALKRPQGVVSLEIKCSSCKEIVSVRMNLMDIGATTEITSTAKRGGR